ncbi:MAG TPA: hypothetical protein VFA63_02855 [Pseudonocardiaceae bacterium]|nr:hypothetical protein [Pseudonocardiaceae bacterium]HZU37298.1 hypothetical protein [Gemmataceae bacterium]
MRDIVITPAGLRRFRVQLNEGETRHYSVTVPEELIREFKLSEDDLARVVQQSFIFLLEREPASSIMPEFSLDAISRYFPEYKETLRKRLQSAR